MPEKTYIQKVIDEAMIPIKGAIDQLKIEMAETLNLPTAPWQIVKKPYDKLDEWELQALMDIFHTDGEEKPCPMCHWASIAEVQKLNAAKKQGLA